MGTYSKAKPSQSKRHSKTTIPLFGRLEKTGSKREEVQARSERSKKRGGGGGGGGGEKEKKKRGGREEG